MGIDKPGPSEEEIGGAPGDFPVSTDRPQDHPDYWKAQVMAKPDFKERAVVPFAAYSRKEQEKEHAEIEGRRLEREADPEAYFRKQSRRIRSAVESKLEKYKDLVEIDKHGDEVLKLGLSGKIEVIKGRFSTVGGGEHYEIRIGEGDFGDWHGFSAAENGTRPSISRTEKRIGPSMTDALNSGDIDNYGLQTALEIVEAAESPEVEQANREREKREAEEARAKRAEEKTHQKRSRFSLRRTRSRSQEEHR